MTPKPRRFARQRGLTLREIVALASIVAALTGILAPVFRPASQRSEARKCLSNLRRIAAGIAMYADDNGGRLMWNPYDVSAYDNPSRDTQANFILGLAPYVPPATWACPSARLKTTSVSLLPGQYWVHPSYPLDSEAYPSISYGFNEVAIGSAAPGLLVKRAPAALRSIARPSHVALIGESNMMYASYMVRVVNGAYVADINGAKPGELYWVWSSPKQTAWTYGRVRHAGGMNFAYADGHAAFCKPAVLNPNANSSADGYTYGYYPGANVY